MRWLFVPLAIVVFGFAQPVAAQPPWDDVSTAEGWAWDQIQHDQVADLNLRCDPNHNGNEILPHKELDSRKDAGWDDDCRRIRPEFITDVLTDPRWRDQIKRHGVRLRGARIAGTLDLSNAEIGAELSIDASRIDGTLDLTGAHLAHALSLKWTRVLGQLAAGSLRTDSSLHVSEGATFKSDVVLTEAKVGGSLEVIGSTFEGTVKAERLSIERSLSLSSDDTFMADVELRGAEVGGTISMVGSVFNNVYGERLAVEGALLMLGHATFKGDLVLTGASIGNDLDLSHSTFEGTVGAQSVKVGGPVFAYKARFIGGPVDFKTSHISGGLDLRGAIANRIDLSSAVVAQDLLLGGGGEPGLQWQCADWPPPVPWPPAVFWPLGDPRWRTARCGVGACALPKLILRNTQVGALQDNADAWPPDLDLEGFKYDRLGGIGGEETDDMRRRSPEQWENWLERDHTFSTQPYAQLAAVLLAAGRRETAETIQYFGRGRERDEVWARSKPRFWIWLTVLGVAGCLGLAGYRIINRTKWFDRTGSRASRFGIRSLLLVGASSLPALGVGFWLMWNWGASIWLFFFGIVAGYGIGLRTFRVLGWVVVLTLLGAAVLWFSPARSRGVLWVLGASLHRLLPIVELNKEFKDFFDNPPPAQADQPRNLNPFQVAFFSLIALAGWVLGFFLLAAMSGLAPKG
jgi:hypothetical protein